MTVWIVEEGDMYEPTVILGVFATQEAAHRAYPDAIQTAGFRTVTDHEVQS